MAARRLASSLVSGIPEMILDSNSLIIKYYFKRIEGGEVKWQLN